MTAPANKNAFLFVLVTVTLNMIGFGLIIPVIPQFLEELTGYGPEEAIVWGGALTATYALMNFLAGPTLGALSDQYGRRPILLASIATLVIDFLIMGFATSLAILFVGRALAGLSSATFSTANAYVADVTAPEDRGKAFGMIGAAFGVGFILGPAIGGLLGDINTRLPFFAAAALGGINFLYGMFVLPESLTPDKRRKLDMARANPFGAFKHFSKLPKVSWFLLAVGVFGFAHVVYPATWNFHGEIRYNWTSSQIGASLALVGIGAAVVQAGLLGQFIKRIGEVRTALFALAMGTLSLIGFAFSSAPWMAYVIIPLSAFGGMAGPAVNAIMSKQTPANAQGELQGAVSSIQSLGMIIGPIVMTQTLHTFSKDDAVISFAGAAFLLAALLTGLSSLVFWRGVKANRIALTAPDT